MPWAAKPASAQTPTLLFSKGRGRPSVSPERDGEENAQAPEARKDTSAGKGGGEQNQGKKSLNKAGSHSRAGPREEGMS